MTALPPLPPDLHPTDVEARDGYRLWLRYSDGTSGEVDLGDLVGKGVFRAWHDRAFFEAVRLDGHGGIVWSEELDLCGDALYLRLRGLPEGGRGPNVDGGSNRSGSTGDPMPELCRFYGIVIRMFRSDHVPPHFHARYGGSNASFDIQTLGLLRGQMPPRARSLVIEWASRHQDDLLDAWHRSERHEPLGKIAPLE